MTNYKKCICMVAAIALLVVVAFSGFKMYHYYSQKAEQEELFEDMARVVEEKRVEQLEVGEEGELISHGSVEEVFAEYSELYLQNGDMVGWIRIEGTTIHYPVMQTPRNPDYYLEHNFYKEYSDLGVPYIQADCNILKSDNLIIYGHHLRGQRMFGALEAYKSQEFYKEHKSIQFDTLSRRGEYEIIAVFQTVAYQEEGYRYYDFVDAEDEGSFQAYVEQCKALSLYEIEETAVYGDKLITLSTCEYSTTDGRLVVVAKKVI